MTIEQACSIHVSAAEQSNPGKVVMVLIDKLEASDLNSADTPALYQLSQKGALGLMLTNVATGYPKAANHTYATIGAGVKSSGGTMGGYAFGAAEHISSEKAGDLYRRNTGNSAGKETLVHLGLISAINDNVKLKQPEIPGALGEALGRHGIKTAVIGNADLPAERNPNDQYARQAVSIAMNRTGLVDYGDVGPLCYKKDLHALAGISTDYGYLLNRYNQYRTNADFLVIETGDISRIEALKTIATQREYLRHKKAALKNIDDFVGKLSQELDLSSDLLMVISPGPSDHGVEEGNWQTPILMVGKNIQKGLLVSGTTKQTGVITNTDIAPTVLNHWNINSEFKNEDGAAVVMAGQRIFSQAADEPQAQIEEKNAQGVFLHQLRYPLVKLLINGAFVILILSIILLAVNSRYTRFIKPFWLILTTMPIVLLVAGKAFISLSHRWSLISATAVTLAVSALAAFMMIKKYKEYGRKPIPFLITAIIITLLILGDTLLGAPLGKTSPLSYDLMAGARFYGIGNEYMGVLIGAALFIAALLSDFNHLRGRAGRILLPVMFTIVLAVIASPALGANLGGAIAGAAGFGTAVVVLLHRRIEVKHIMGIALGAALILSALFIFDSGRLLEAQTHIGRTAALVQAGGLSELVQIAVRKLAVNYKIIKSTTWSWFYFLSLIIIIGGYKIFPRQHEAFINNHPWFNQIKTGVLAGSVFALLFNDSGVVAAATCILYTIAPYMYGLIECGIMLNNGILKERTSGG